MKGRAALGLLAAWAAAAAGAVPDADCQPCDVAKTCDTIQCKVPAVTQGLPPGPGPTQGMSNDSRVALEHLIGHGLRRAAAVEWVSAEFSKRAANVLVAGRPDLNRSAALLAGFAVSGADWQQNAGYTGYVGPDPDAIEQVLQSGNIRERWGLVYVLTKSHGFSAAVRPLADAAVKANSTATLDALGLNSAAVLQRRDLVAKTEQECAGSGACRYAAVPDFAFPPFDSWVRFDFAVAQHWNGSRAYYPKCRMTGWMSNNKSIVPPLSANELKLQCNGTGPCMLSWCQGDNAEYVVNADFAPGVPGYLARATKLGYRTVAGPSGTTSNVLQLGLLLGFTPDELALLRLTMAAWMLPTNDHSLLEILLGGDPYLSPEFTTAWTISDIGRLMPRDIIAGGQRFDRAAVWAEVAAELSSDPATCAALPKDTLYYLRTLDASMCNSTA